MAEPEALPPDSPLLPREAVRLAALGFLADGPRSYASLASEVRNFTSRYAGPALEMMTSSIELLRHEGLITLVHSGDAPGPDALLELSDDGLETLRTMLRGSMRAPLNDMARLVLALKFRFLHILPDGDRQGQLQSMINACETDLARLVDLRTRHNQDPGHLTDWLDHDIGQIEDRLEWLRGFLTRLEEEDINSG